MSVGQYAYVESGYLSLTELLHCMPDRLQDDIHSRLITLYNQTLTSLTDQEKAEWVDRPMPQKTPMETLRDQIQQNQTLLDEANHAIATIETNQEQEFLNYRKNLEGYPPQMKHNMEDNFKSTQTETLKEPKYNVFNLQEQKSQLLLRLKHLPTIL